MALYAGHFDFTQPLLKVVPDLFSAEECRAALAHVADGPWLPATVNGREGREVNARLRDNSTAVVRDESLARRLFERVTAHVPARMRVEDPERGGRLEMAVDGVFVPLRVYRYEVGQHFGLHQDQSYATDDGARSLLTLLVYLNDDFEGGATDFPEQSRRIAPVAGSALWFQHMLLHAGRRVERGTKYVLRSDVLYRPT